MGTIGPRRLWGRAQGHECPWLHQAQAMAKLRQFRLQDQMRTQAAQQNYPQFAEKFKQFKQSTWKAYSDEKRRKTPDGSQLMKI